MSLAPSSSSSEWTSSAKLASKAAQTAAAASTLTRIVPVDVASLLLQGGGDSQDDIVPSPGLVVTLVGQCQDVTTSPVLEWRMRDTSSSTSSVACRTFDAATITGADSTTALAPDDARRVVTPGAWVRIYARIHRPSKAAATVPPTLCVLRALAVTNPVEVEWHSAEVVRRRRHCRQGEVNAGSINSTTGSLTKHAAAPALTLDPSSSSSASKDRQGHLATWTKRIEDVYRAETCPDAGWTSDELRQRIQHLLSSSSSSAPPPTMASILHDLVEDGILYCTMDTDHYRCTTVV